MSICIFVQVRCAPGTTYKAADAISLREFDSEPFSTSSDYDLLLKVYVPDGKNTGRFVNECFAGSENTERTLTTIAFNAF